MTGSVRSSKLDRDLVAGDRVPRIGKLTFGAGSQVELMWNAKLVLFHARCTAQASGRTVAFDDDESIGDACEVRATPMPLEVFGADDAERVNLLVGEPDQTWAKSEKQEACFDEPLGLLSSVVDRQFGGAPPPSAPRKLGELAWRRLAAIGRHRAAHAIAEKCKFTQAVNTFASSGVKPLPADELGDLLASCHLLKELEKCDQ